MINRPESSLELFSKEYNSIILNYGKQQIRYQNLSLIHEIIKNTFSCFMLHNIFATLRHLFPELISEIHLILNIHIFTLSCIIEAW